MAKKPKKKQANYYLCLDVLDFIDEESRKYGKTKTRIVEECVRERARKEGK